jgi:hypothetical protein
MNQNLPDSEIPPRFKPKTARSSAKERRLCNHFGEDQWSIRSRCPSKPRLPGFAEESIRKARNALPLAPNGIGGHAG